MEAKKDYRLYWIWLAESAGQASKTAVKLVNLFGNAKGVYLATAEDLDSKEIHDLDIYEYEKAKRILKDKSLDAAEKILEDAAKLGQRVVVPTDRDFPIGLLSLRDAPMVLYVYGDLRGLNDELMISIVGTRTMSDIGRRNAYSIGYGVASSGAVVVSGMALGSDGMALTGAICAGGRTVAVLGGGVDVIYPKDHMNLYNTILRKGAVISEYPPGSEPKGAHFPVRNRLISGISAGSVVIEGSMQSGALITARHALYQGRLLFAIPGDINDPGAEGTNDLLKQGAIITTGPDDVMTEFEFLYPHSISIKAMRRAIRGRDMDAASEEAMAKLRISARDGQKYYGQGSYGSKNSWVGKQGTPKKAPKVSKADIKNSEERVVMGGGFTFETPMEIRSAGVNSPEPELTSQKILIDTMTETADCHTRIELDLLDEIGIKVYNMMKPDVPMIPDELVCDGISVSEVLSSLSMLELAGAVESGAGGYFLRRSSDEFELPE